MRVFVALLLVAMSAGQASAERRVALVLGADEYRQVRPLQNAVTDAESVEAALEALGFEVTLETDRDLKRTRRALEDFREDGAGADVALVFFAGHGVEIAGENRLLPVDADVSSLEALKRTTLPLEEVRAAVAEIAGVGLIVLDACRDDPFGAAGEEGSRGVKALSQAKDPVVKPGLGRMGRAENILFAFSAAPGETASDGSDGHSPFAAALEKYLGTEGLEIRSVLTLVQQEVYDRSQGKQLPYVESGLPTLFFAAKTDGTLPERERLLLAMAGVTPDLRGEVEAIATEADMPLAPLYGALIASEAAALDPQARSEKLRQAAEAFVRVRSDMRALASDDPQVEQLRDEAEAQLALGAFDTAQLKLAEAAELDASSRKSLKDNYLKRTLSEAATHYLSGGAAESRGSLFQAMKAYRRAADLYAEIGREPFPPDDRQRHIAVLEALAATQIELGALADALDTIDAFAATAAGHAGTEPTNALWQHNLAVAAGMKGDLRATLGDYDGALRDYVSAQDHARRAADLEPAAQYRRGMSVVLDKVGRLRRSRGDLRGAMAAYNEGIGIALALMRANPLDEGLQSDLAYYDVQLGDILRVLGNEQDALAAFRAALDIRRRLAAGRPDDAQRQFDLGVSAERVGDVLAGMGSLAEAETFLKERHEIITALAARSPDNTAWQRDLSVSNEKFGDLEKRRGNHEAALREYLKAQEITARLAALDPSNMSWQRDLSIGYRKLGEMRLTAGQTGDALADYRESLRISESMAATDPGNLDWRSDVATGHNRLGEVQARLGNLPAARTEFSASLRIVEELAALDPSNADWQWNLFACHTQLAESGETPAAHYRSALEIADKLARQNRLADWHKPHVERVRKLAAEQDDATAR